MGARLLLPGISLARITVFSAVMLALACGPTMAGSVANFYAGKTISLDIGLPPGGGYDTYGRMVARHIGEHIPGHPSVIAQNMPGAGGIKAADYIYNSAPKDGTEFGIIPASALLEPLFGSKQARFEAAKFSWLGSASQEVHFCGVGPRSHIASFDQWLKSGKELTFGASGPAAVTYQHPMVLKNVLHANVKVIAGYRGSPDIALAVQRGEVDGICLDVSSLEARYHHMLDSGKLELLIQMGPHKDESFGEIPSVFDYAKTAEQRQILSLAFDQGELGRPFMAPPGIPRARYEALYHAFADTLKDPAVLAEAEKSKLDIDYVSGEQAQSLLQKFADYPPSVVQKAKAALGLP